MTKKYKHSCGLYAVFHSERCQTPENSAQIPLSLVVVNPIPMDNAIATIVIFLWVNPQLAIICIPDPIFDSQIYQNTAESLILPGFFSGVFSFYYIVFFLNQIWMIDFYDFSRDCLLSFWISFIFLLVRNS